MIQQHVIKKADCQVWLTGEHLKIMPITNIKKLITKRIYLTLGDEIVALVQIAKTDSSLLLKVTSVEKAFDSKKNCLLFLVLPTLAI